MNGQWAGGYNHVLKHLFIQYACRSRVPPVWPGCAELLIPFRGRYTTVKFVSTGFP
jgi:hypothetical protein